jgi:hypothetical protein
MEDCLYGQAGEQWPIWSGMPNEATFSKRKDEMELALLKMMK